MTVVRAIPCDSGQGLMGGVRALMRAPHLFPAELGWRHGGVAAFRALHKPFVAVTDAALIRHILVTAAEQFPRSYHLQNAQLLLGQGLLSTDGPVWHSRRRQMQPAFGTALLRRVAADVAAVTATMLALWDTDQKAGRPVEAVLATRRLTMAVISQVLFSAPIDDATADRLAGDITRGLALLMRRNTSLWAPPLWMPFPQNRALRQIRDGLEGFVGRHLRQRRQRPAKTAGDDGDLLDIILALRDPEAGDALADDGIVDEAKTLFGAGFETTATALSWALYLLAGHPEIATKLQEEVDRVLGGRVPGYADLANLPMAQAIVQETLRLYPPVYTSPRVCRQSMQWQDFRLRQGTTFLLSIYGLHRDPQVWAAADRFQPDRFLSGADWSKSSFLPFGAGRHTCIGNAFAMVEMQIVLAMIAQRFHLHRADPDPVGMRARIVLAPDRDIPLRLEPRR